MLFASIDIGTNAVRLFFANVFEKKGAASVEKASLIRIPLRLGEDVFSKGFISEEKTKKLLDTMMAFKLLIDVYEPVNYIACATAAMREASNSAKIINDIKQYTNLDIRVIDGIEEANILGATNNTNTNRNHDLSMYVDVGGGSTEISIVSNNKMIDSISFKIGTIRLLNNKVEETEWENMKSWLKKYKNDFGKVFLIGSGGNINKLAKIYGDNISNTLNYSVIKKAYSHLNKFTLNERIEVLGMRPDRADVILPAATIFINIMKWSKAESIYVPKIGLADGLIHKLFREYKESIK
ncbi:MAG: exopolyphosphatase [Bacteroidetes bacterium]|nr:exopolyphosphatase [Bacteroidota bacterium]